MNNDNDTKGLLMAFPIDESTPLLDDENNGDGKPARMRVKKHRRLVLPEEDVRAFAKRCDLILKLIDEKSKSIAADAPLAQVYQEFYTYTANIIKLSKELAKHSGYHGETFYKGQNLILPDELAYTVHYTEVLIENPADKTARRGLLQAKKAVEEYTEKEVNPYSFRSICSKALAISIVGAVGVAACAGLLALATGLPLGTGACLGVVVAAVASAVVIYKQIDAYKKSHNLTQNIDNLLNTEISVPNNSPTPGGKTP